MTSHESRNTSQCLLAAGTNVYHVLAVGNAKGNEATSQTNDPANITKHAYSKNHVMYTLA